MSKQKDTVVIALDLGTTGNRALAFNTQGEIVADAYTEFTQHFPKPAWVEHDPEEILSRTYHVLKTVIEKVGLAHIESIGITNQRETTILWNKRTGKPVYNAIVWQCRRTTEMCREYTQYHQMIKEKTGLFLDPYFSATKIKWILDNVSGLTQAIDKGDLLFGTVDTWILWHLTGKKVHATDTSNASRTMLFNIHTIDYDQELLDLFQIPKQILPDVKSSNSMFGNVDATLFGKEIPITAILGDQQAALFAQCGTETGRIKNTYGTGLFVVASTGTQCVPYSTLVNTIAWTLDDETSYALEGSIFVGGSAIQWLRDQLGIISSASETEALASTLTSNDGVYFVPALAGLGAPYWKADARGSFFGITRQTGKQHLIRAALEAMAYQTKDVIEEINHGAQSLIFDALHVDGGAASNAFLLQFQADILNLPVHRPKILETTALGVAGLAGISIGFWTLDSFQKLKTIDATFLPQLDPSLAADYYNGWRAAVAATLSF